MDISKLFNPKSLVVVGASDNPRGMAGGATTNALLGSIKDRLYFINPRRDEVKGKKAYKCVADLPEVPECAIICTPAKTVVGYLEELGAAGTKAAVVFASGFGEEHSEEAQQLNSDLINVCKKYEIALLGPNCIGFANTLDNIRCCAANISYLDEENYTKGRGMGVVCQSGYVTGGFTNPSMKNIAYLVSVGNCAVCDIEDYLLMMAKDERVTCIATYIEGIKNPQLFEEAAKVAAEAKKPFIILKAGMSEKGGLATASHTGSLAGNFATFEAVCKKFGIIVTKNLHEFVSTARMFSVVDGNFPTKFGVAGVNFSGGENTMCVDLCEKYGLELIDFSETILKRLTDILPSFAKSTNPIDVTTAVFQTPEIIKETFAIVSEDENVGMVVMANTVSKDPEPQDRICSTAIEELKVEGRYVAPCFVTPSFERTRNDEIIDRFERMNTPMLGSGETGYQSLKHLIDFTKFKYEEIEPSLAIPDVTLSAENTITLSEKASKEELSRFGIPVPKQAVATSEEELRKWVNEFQCELVLKISSKDIPHKTEAGGVKLFINGEDAAVKAYNEILASCKNYKPDAEIEGVLVQEMVPNGLEAIIGVNNDAQFGPMMLVGLGGIFVELFKDVSLYPCPINKVEATNMVKSLKAYKMFEGYRGSLPLDVDALTDMMVSLSNYVVENKNVIKEIDVNPVFVYEVGKGVKAADALIIKNNL